MKRLVKRLVRALGYDIQRAAPPVLSVQALERSPEEYELLAAFVTRTAQQIIPLEVSQAVRNLHLTGILRPTAYPQVANIAPGGAGTPSIGIWSREARAGNSGFVRRTDRQEEAFYWAKQERIEPKRKRWRVVFLGESVARGFLYDPHFTPAAVLEGMLKSQLGPHIDVVDLAKSNLGMAELKELIGQSLALKPDLIVIFAGNNWHQQIADIDIPYVDTLLRRDGPSALKAFLENRARRAIRVLGEQVNELLKQRSHPEIMWVVPEFNLLDWVDPPLIAPVLPGNRNAIWLDLDQRAARSWRDGDAATAATLAREMVELDGGTSAVPLRLLAQCSRAAGNIDEARRYLEMARDADGWDPSFAYSPRPTAAIQSALREIASASRNHLVDAPELIRSHLGGQPPGRSIFLDYCHLTSAGIKLLMAAIASQAISILAHKVVPPEALLGETCSPPARVEGMAAFLAAVHNAHFNQGAELVTYWCKRAVDLWPESPQLMARYLDFLNERTPHHLLSRSILELLECDELGVADYLFRGYKPRLDTVLTTAISESLRSIGDVAGQSPSPRRPSIAVRHASATSSRTDLNDFYYSSHLARPDERAWTTRAMPMNRRSHNMYASALWKISKFAFVAEQSRAARLKLTYRLPPSSAAEGKLAISIGGRCVAQAIAAPGWQTIEFSIPGDCIVDGVNEISVSWPEPEDTTGLLEQISDALVSRRMPRFHRVFGEVHSLKLLDSGQHTELAVSPAAAPPTGN